MAGRQPTPTVQYLGVRLTVQSSVPGDPYAQPKDFFPRDKAGGVHIGRAASNDLQLPHANVSNLHCRIEERAGVFYVEDASSNGTHVGQRALAPGERYALREGDIIMIPPYQITFRKGLSSFHEPAKEDALDSTMQLKKDVVGRFLDDPEAKAPQLKVINGGQRGRSFDLVQYEDFLIGRDSECHLCLTDDAMSRRHAVIRRDWSGVTVRDLDSRNGVQVNGRRIAKETEVTLAHGDQIALGLCTIVFHDPFAAELEQKLQGVYVDGDNTIDGATMLPGQAMAHITKAAESNRSAESIDIREPVSGKWRVPKRSEKAQEPQEPVAQEPARPAPAARPAEPAATPAAATPGPAPQTAPAPVPTPPGPPSAAAPSRAAVAKPASGQGSLLMVGVVIACLLVIVLAMVLAFLL